MKAGIVEPEKTFIARQRFGEHVSAATNAQETIEELLEVTFSVGSAPRLYNEDPKSAEGIIEKRWQRDIWQLAIEGVDKSSARAAMTRGSERGKLKNLHC
jgi:hypothetical protein